MKSLFLLFLLTFAVALAARAELPAGWGTNYPVAISAAAAAPRPALVYFTAAWCGPCKLMARLTLADPEIVQTLAAVECVALDIDAHPDLAARHGVTAVPTLVMLSTAETEVERATGFQSPADFLPWLTNAISRAQAALLHQALTRKTLAEVDQLLGSAATNSLSSAAVKLFDLCDERDSAVASSAADRLKTIAGHAPAVLLDGLGDARLAVRIRVANALRDQLGEAFDVDPWSDPAAREKHIAAWREALAKMSPAKSSGKPGL